MHTFVAILVSLFIHTGHALDEDSVGNVNWCRPHPMWDECIEIEVMKS